ncbi:MAG: response regulator [Myxococcales bacterium]|nr:response regulator [Myxococcales bacterium]MDD9967485.1 response regulator [Myxococcales bacterium]
MASLSVCRRPRVLVVEDSSMARSELREALEDAYDVIEAKNGAEALSRAGNEAFDVVVADINMPVMGGIEFVRLLRGLPSHAQVPVIVVTAESSDEVVQRGRAAGVNAWMVKPLSPSGLVNAVERFAPSLDTAG